MKKIYALGLLLTMLSGYSMAQYCTTGVGPSNTADSNIESFSLNGETTNINFTGCPGVLGVDDQTAQSADLIAGNSYAINVGWGSCSGFYYSGVGEIWIDYDGSETFDAGESIGTGIADGVAVVNDVINFTVPAGALNGTHRIRVMQWEFGTNPLDPCGSFTYGSVTDFSVVISGGTSCGPPTALNVSNVTPTSADLNWTPDGGAVDHEVEWGFPGFAPGTAAEEGSASNVVGGTTNATGLTANTAYEFYVQTDCGGSQSSWAGPFAFTTPCLAIAAPWLETFTGTTDPACWSQTATTGGPWVYTGDPDYDVSGTLDHTSGSVNNYAWMDFSGTDAGVSLISPIIDVSALTTPLLSFWEVSYSTGVTTYNSIFVEAWDGSAWVQIDEIVGDFGPNWFEHTYDLSAYTYSGNLVQLRFRAESGGDTFDYENDLLLDDVSIIEAPSCIAPNALTTSNITGNSVDFGWTENNGAAEWQIEYGPAGFTQGTGTTLITTNNPETISGLSSLTAYDFYVRTICGAGDTSVYAGPISATTLISPLSCSSGNPFTIYETSFEGGVPAGWSQVATADPDWTWDGAGGTGSTNTGPSGANTGVGFMYLETSGGTTGESDTLIAAAIDLSDVVDAARVTFYYHMYGADIGSLEVLASNDNINFSSIWSQTGQQQSDETDPWQATEADLTAYAGGMVYLRFVGTKGGTGFEGDLAIDDVVVEGCVDCPGPSNLTASNTTSTSTELNWTTAGFATEWEIEYGPTGFTPGSGTSMITTNNPETISGLSALTEYDFYVRAVCGAGDSSSWVGPEAVTTPIAPLNCTSGNPTVLLLEDFEGGFPAGWSQVATAAPDWTWDGAGGTGSTNTGPSGAYSGSGFVYLECSGAGVGETDTLFAPSVNLSSTVGDARATWKYHMYGDVMGKMAFEVSTDGVLWNEIWSDSGELQMDETDPWATAEADLTPYVGNIVQMRFVGTAAGTFEGDMAIDTFAVESCISCPDPSGIVASNATTTTVDLNWTIGDSETAWIVEYGPTGFTPGTGTTVNVTNNVDETITGLVDNTEYDFYVYADCGGGDVSLPIGPATDTTLVVCDPPTGLTVVYEGQDSLALTWTPGGLESEWTVDYGPVGYTPGTGTSHLATLLPDTTFNIPTGVWEFYVQANCTAGGLNNPWAGPITYISPIQNDSTCDAITVPVDGSVTNFANVNATEQVGEPTSGFNTVWFEFTAPASGHVEVRTCGTDFDNMLEVYEATDCSDFGTFSLVTAATGNPFTTCTGVDPAGANLCGLTPGQTYYLVVGAENATDEGIFPLQLTELPAVNAGTASPIDVCEDNSAVDLFTSINGNLTTNGQWYNPAVGAGNEVTPTINVVGLPAGTYPVFYVDQELCGSDTVESSITVVELPNVGTGSTLNAGCNFGPVNLYEGISGTVDLGGTWYDTDGNDLGEGTVNYDGEPAGTYTYYYVVDNGVCAADTATVDVTVIDCASIEDNELGLDVYPNPVQDVLNIQFENLDGSTTFQLTAVNGQIVTAPINVLINSATIDMSGVADGVYFLRVTSNGTTEEVRIVKQ